MQSSTDDGSIRRSSPLFRTLIIISFFDLISWALAAAAIAITRKEDSDYAAELRAWYAAGGPNQDCTYKVAHSCRPYETGAGMQFVLLMTLLPLVFDAVLLPLAIGFGVWGHLHPAWLLSQAVFAFLVWTACGAFDAFHSWVSMVDKGYVGGDAFDHVWGGVAGMQVVMGMVWLVVMIAAARRVHRRNRRKWMARGVNEVRLQVVGRMGSESTVVV